MTFTDGWHVQGLRGTGSYDYSLADVFVPAHRCFPLFATAPERGSSPLPRMGLLPVTAAGHASWALGVSKSLLDDVAELALTKSRMSDMDTLANRQTFQRNLAHHTGMWRAARAGVVEAFCGAEAAVSRGDAFTPTMRADLRVAATYATEASREIAQWAHLAAGTTAIRTAAGSSEASATSTPAPSTRSSARRRTWTPRRSGSASPRTSPASDAVPGSATRHPALVGGDFVAVSSIDRSTTVRPDGPALLVVLERGGDFVAARSAAR